jgi:ribosomal protein L40E
MPPIRDREPPQRWEVPPEWRLQEVEKKGVMCTVCMKVYWGFTNIGQLNRCRKCGNTEFTRFINVSSADFNKYSGRFLREDELPVKRRAPW